MNRAGRVVAVAAGMLAATCALPFMAIAPAVAASSTPTTAVDSAPTQAVSTAHTYPGDPDAEAALVASEERRLIDVRSLMSAAERLDLSNRTPYRLDVGSIPSLILPSRPSPYSIEELARMAPRSISVPEDGVFVVREHIVVGPGATLRLVGRDGITVRLASESTGFVSIIAAGGSLVIAGEPSAPTVIESWNDSRGEVDTTTADGRAYVRVFGGRAEFTNVEFTDLGFWSGITGGVALTGTVLPDAVDGSDSSLEEVETIDGGANESGAGGTDESVAAGTDESDAGSADETAAGSTEAPAAEGLEEYVPLDLDTLSLESTVESDSLGYASGLVQSVTFARNAFGLFVTNSDGVVVRDSLIEDSLVDGLVMHRDVSNSTVASSVSRDNARDGMRLTRASTTILLDRVEATGNGRNGITIESGALVEGPSATGISTTVYGNNEVSLSNASDNGRYGIEIVGGTAITIRGNTVERNVMGIVVTEGATSVAISDNQVSESASHGISMRNAGLDLEVVGNRVEGARIGIYARDAGGAIERNEVLGVSIHGVTLVGDTGASTIVGNEISGSGPSAVDVVRTTGTAVRDNDVSEWQSTKPLTVVLAAVFQPLTILWISIAILLLVGTLVARRRQRGIHDPFADRAPLTSLTRGIVARDELVGPRGV